MSLNRIEKISSFKALKELKDVVPFWSHSKTKNTATLTYYKTNNLFYEVHIRDSYDTCTVVEVEYV